MTLYQHKHLHLKFLNISIYISFDIIIQYIIYYIIRYIRNNRKLHSPYAIKKNISYMYTLITYMSFVIPLYFC